MPDDLAADVARVLAALLDAKAWFRRGITDDRICELTGLSLSRVVSARRELAAQGLAERQAVAGDNPLTVLTPIGVARAQTLFPPAEEPGA